MASQARAEFLERKLEKQMREHAKTMENIETELQMLKAKPRVSKDQRPRNDNVPKKVGRSENTRNVPAKSLKKDPVDDRGTILNGEHNNNNSGKTNSSAGDKMTNKMNVQNHPHAAGDMTPSVFRTSSLYTVDSHDTCMSVADTVMTKINYNGSIVSSPLSPIKLLEFLFMELRSKLKDYVSEGDEDIAKAFTEINQTIKKAKMERRLYREARRNKISSSAQTEFDGNEIDKLVDFEAKHMTMQSELDGNLRRMEEIFTLELKKSDDKITKLSEDINLLQQKLRSGIDAENTTMSHHIDLKTEEIKGEMKFLLRMIEETKNHNLIDNFNKKLAQTQRKIDDVKRKCTETAKCCLQMHVGNHLVNSHSMKTKQMECELGQIKSVVDMNIRELKNVLMRLKSSSISSSSSSSSMVTTAYLAESIISSAKFDENTPREEGRGVSNCCDDRFSSADDDDDAATASDDDDDEKDNDLMANE